MISSPPVLEGDMNISTIYFYSNGGRLILYENKRVYTAFPDCTDCKGTGIFLENTGELEQCYGCSTRFSAYATLKNGVEKLNKSFKKLFNRCVEKHLTLDDEKLSQHPQWRKLTEYEHTLSTMQAPTLIRKEIYDTSGALCQSFDYPVSTPTAL